MSDFTSGFWSIYISVITVVSIVGCGVFLKALSTRTVKRETVETTGHTWDEDLSEFNNPLPRWWIWLFYITIAFSLVYLALYPGLGSFGGSFGWSSKQQYEDEIAQAEKLTAPLFDKYAKTDLKQLASDPAAMALGQKLFLNNCALCHASDARGAKGYPNLADSDWLFGGDPETIKETIAKGRNGVMPPWGAVLGDDGVKDVAHYVLSISGRTFDSLRAARGKEKFAATCVACHGPEGKGIAALGSANLTKTNLSFGADEPTLIETISKGRNVVMPAQLPLLGEAKVHILAAYVWSLSNTPGAAAK